MRNSPILAEIAAAIPSLRKSEVKVAEYVLRAPQQVMHMRIVDLAQEAQVSEPTIVRFCRGIGCNGFQEFKVRIAQEMAITNNIGQFAIIEDDSIEDICDKIADTTIQRLHQVKTQLQSTQVAAAANAISNARRVEFYGFGASGAVAIDAQHKFFRLQVATAAYSDPHMQSMSAVTLSEQDVVVAISQSGRTKDLLHSVQLAQQHGAMVVSLAPANTALSAAADLPININIEEDTEQFTPMTSRIAHLMVIDMLAVAVTQRRGPEFAAHLNAIKRSIKSLRLESD
ncbi:MULTISPECIES: SIS domain-containing protein [Oceanospirillaceae]|mgnify:FL=1|uniref:SIS domain-containing protein n=1 Tax=Thalassolituus hydrocarboniclasticus TaxID=2742796 RepID=A0ABY6A6U2_9GAMM|nr:MULTISPECIES: SIS domain-containing protein [Thalassolituus]MAY15409.1 transcriptional regulator [Oceanospirillaceae bacterium]MCA6059180.1 SIS domain-containing protein [Thalassolituus sp. ST750PaO-4]PIQ39131.1 MAG: transcriptional regulator [Thalassolituus sp. CG17_big_fil_post_rev_8_21_14_2_50_53_8]MCB2386503.1 SIS domain-containing protein [Thalassolituus alkanivorans]MCB2422986.1 SIS domain-containing protein [Thalassolituus alkanivorans]